MLIRINSLNAMTEPHYSNKKVYSKKKVPDQTAPRLHYSVNSILLTCADPEGGGGPDPPKNHKIIGFLSNIGSDPLNITKLPSLHSMLGHHRPASETSAII